MTTIKNPELAIFDLDNTLYDWVSYFVPAFYAMVDRIVEVTGCERAQLLSDFQAVHQRFSDTEHPFAFLDTGVFKDLELKLGRKNALDCVDSAFHAFNSVRKRSLVLYDGALDTISSLSERNVSLIAYTESSSFASIDRLNRLGITDYFDGVYCRAPGGSLHPNAPDMSIWNSKNRKYGVVEFSRDHRKPAPEILLRILSDSDVEPERAFYVGDSLAKDVWMAKKANVFAVWAKYGTRHNPESYERLVRVSHWTDADISRERLLINEADKVVADYVAEHSPREIMECVAFDRDGEIS